MLCSNEASNVDLVYIISTRILLFEEKYLHMLTSFNDLRRKPVPESNSLQLHNSNNCKHISLHFFQPS